MKPITMMDISNKLAEIAPPGEMQEEKKAAVEQLYIDSDESGENVQGHYVADDLSSYPEF
tara:strand:+ start:459 stop:638 length:180 start_codon:yes stop_codon:yes gene_type:complete